MKPVDSRKGKPAETYPLRLYLAFAALAVVSCLGLDFLAARRGQPAYLFSSAQDRPAEPAAVAPLTEPLTEPVPRPIRETAVSEKDVEAAPESGARPRSEPAEPAKAPAREKIAAIIIDDMGNSLDALQDVFDLDIPVTVSILPRSPHALETAQAAHDRRLEVLLHLPCESLNHQEVQPPLSPVIRTDMGPGEIRALAAEALDSVPFVTGVNNHMGSKLTKDRAAMTPILDVLKARKLFFIDSMTGGRSVAYDQARRMGVPAAYRHVFLDSEVGADYSRDRLVELFELAQKNGKAVAIGHPFPETFRALRHCRALADKYGVRLVAVSAVLPD
jgi:hypothetical protein